MPFIQPLLSSNIDIIGDVHGEIGALCSLLARMRYDGNGTHPEGRKLVFVGDLIDRGPDSIAVFQLVKHFVAQGNAQTILGNHELNLLLPEDRADPEQKPKHKHGNHWFHGETENMLEKTTPNALQFQRLATEVDRKEIVSFLRTLPIALENDSIRVVHACWDQKSIEMLRSEMRDVVAVTHHYEDIIEAKNIPKGVERSLARQNENPIKLLSSGREQALDEGEEPYFTGGKNRYTKRSKWWNTYTDPQYVVFGHYWRTRFPKKDHNGKPLSRDMLQIGDKNNIPLIFDPQKPFSWLGPKNNCMCIDYSVGRRFWERHNNFPLGATGTSLAALRFYPTAHSFKKILFFDDGSQKDLT